MKKHFYVDRFCTHCHATTRWQLDRDDGKEVYRCIGDDQRHPERKVHGCSKVFPVLDFLAKAKSR